MRPAVAAAIAAALLLACAASADQPAGTNASPAEPATPADGTNTVAGMCTEGKHVSVKLFHELEAVATVMDVELRPLEEGVGADLVLLAAVDDAFAASFWGLYSASPLARFTRLEAGFPGVEGGHVTCETVVKTCGDWNTLVLFRCPVPEPFLDAYHAAAATNGGAVQTFTLSLESSPSRGLAALPVCMWEQKPARSEDATERTAAVCVRPFRPFFFGTTTPSISEEQVMEWTFHHLNAGIDRIYLFDRYEDGRGPGKPTLENYLAPLLGDSRAPLGPTTEPQRIQIQAMPYFSAANVTFDELVTRSYIFDQAAVMEMCFMQARREAVDWVLHIDFDEYMHFSPAPGQTSLKGALQRAEEQCGEEFGGTADYGTYSVVVPRRTVVNTAFDWASPNFAAEYSGFEPASGLSAPSYVGTSTAVSASGASALSGTSAKLTAVSQAGLSASSAGQGWGMGVSGAGLSDTSASQGWGAGVSGAGLSAASAGQGWGISASGVGMSASSAGQGWGMGVSGTGLSATSASQGWGAGVSGDGLSATSGGQGWGTDASGVGISASSAGQGWASGVSGAGLSASSAGQGWEDLDCEDYYYEYAEHDTGSDALGVSGQQLWGEPISATGISAAGLSAPSAGQGWGSGVSGAGMSATSAGQGWGVGASGAGLSATSANQGWGAGVSGAGLSATSASQGWAMGVSGAGLSASSAGQDGGQGVSGPNGLSGASGAQAWAQQRAARCRRQQPQASLPRAGKATSVNLNNVKTAFAVKHEKLGSPFGVHHPCKPEPTDVCVAAVEALWMNHLVDAYATRSSALKPQPPPQAAPAADKSAASEPQTTRSSTLFLCRVAAVAGAAVLLLGAAVSLYQHRAAATAAAASAQFAVSTKSGETEPLLPQSSPAPAHRRRLGTARRLTYWLGMLLFGAVVVMIASHCRTHVTGRHVTTEAGDVSSYHVDVQPPVNLDPETAHRWLVAGPPPTSVAGQLLALSLVHSEDWDLRVWMGEWHSSYLMRLSDGPQAMAAEMVCDFKSAEWKCSGSLSPCVPGTYALEVLHFTQQPKWLYVEGAETSEDKWRKDALIPRTIFTAPLTIVSPPGMSGADPRRMPGCSAASAVTASWQQGARKQLTADSSMAPVDAAVPAVDPSLGMWLNINCADAGSSSNALSAAMLCKQNAKRFSNPEGITWASFPDWGAFFQFFTISNASQPQADQQAFRGMWMPPLASAEWPGMRVPELSGALSSTWMHWAGDSVTFESFAAASSLLRSNNGKDARMLCALPNADAPSGFRAFEPCEPLLAAAAEEGGARSIDRTSEHEWLWLLEVPAANLFLSYSWSLREEGIRVLDEHVTSATAARTLKAKLLCLGYGLSYSREFNSIMATKGGLTALSTSEQSLWAGELHSAGVLLSRPAAPFDHAVVFGPTSTALDIQAWSMDLPALSHMNAQLRRWADLHGAEFADALAFSLPKAWSWADSAGDYIDNVHMAGDLVWAFAEWKLNIAIRAVRRVA